MMTNPDLHEPPVIAVAGLSRKFGEKFALEEVSLTIPHGCVFGLVGANGAGKTTLIKHLLGLHKAQSGQVRVFGLDPVAEPVAVLSRIGFLSEDRDMPGWMTVSELMRYSQAFYPRWDPSYAESLRADFDLDAGTRLKHLSRGEQAKAGLLIALAHRPELVLLDEPSSGLDPKVRREMMEALIRAVAEEGRTVVFSSHLLDEVERISDAIAVLRGGRMVLSGPLEEIKASHRQLTLRFATPPAVPLVLPGMVTMSGSGLEWSVMGRGAIEDLQKAATAFGGRVIEQRQPSLDEIFVTLCARP